MEVSLRRIESKSRYILENLFPYYVYDMSECMHLSPNQNGLYSFDSDTLNPYWTHSDHVPYFINVGSELAGFALVRKYPANREFFDIDQFFVLRKFKGQGVGKKAFQALLENHSGQWQIRVLKENKAALRFWQSAVNHSVGNRYEATLDIDIDLEMHFIRFQNIVEETKHA
ncbi:GNAT family N-acetyltransferase [Enterovibrio calviensis]|uniref:GNAT family N-acetyltransferase n=1 Tax=Enterovibrio calviensis TaxID=91359 RepID=UPI000488A4F1|nr:GNAT family N-acetyltransferase [Enterovibrio calviensis]